jgi:hypothetical protein
VSAEQYGPRKNTPGKTKDPMQFEFGLHGVWYLASPKKISKKTNDGDVMNSFTI